MYTATECLLLDRTSTHRASLVDVINFLVDIGKHLAFNDFDMTSSLLAVPVLHQFSLPGL